MELATLQYSAAHGWSAPIPRDLDSPQTWVLVFGPRSVLTTGSRMRVALDELRAAFPQAVVQGCSSAGEIAGTCVADDSLSVAVARFETVSLVAASTAQATSAESAAAATRLLAGLPAAGLRAVFLLSDGLSVNGTALVAALQRGLPPDVLLSGGLAGDGPSFSTTWVLVDGEPRSGHVTALGLYGDRLCLGHGCNAGWSDFGPERLITRAAGNVLYELDGEPALDLYKNYLGHLAAGLPGSGLLFPLAVRHTASGEPLVRTVMSVNEVDRSMTFAGEMPQGGVARLMRSSMDRLIDSAGEAGSAALQGLDGGDTLVIAVSCIGRRMVLGERTEEELESMVEAAHGRCNPVGFYSYGEISPVFTSGVAELHNQTMTVTAFAER